MLRTGEETRLRRPEHYEISGRRCLCICSPVSKLNSFLPKAYQLSS